MKVWIDQDLCTGDGLCTEIAPVLFRMGDDNLAYVVDDGIMLDGGSANLARVPGDQMDVAIEAADECPGECIFLEVEG